MNSKVSIIILNWNGWKDTIECLESVYQMNYQNYDVIVVDNNSQDDSLDKIIEYAEGNIKIKSEFFNYKESYGPLSFIKHNKNSNTQISNCKNVDTLTKKLILISADKNYGFAEGNNIAIRFALKFLKPEYILILNNDTITDIDLLTELVRSSISTKAMGLSQAKLLYYDYPSILNTTGNKMDKFGGFKGRGSNEKDNKQYDDLVEEKFFYASGACTLINVNFILELDSNEFFDRSFFAYHEDIDMSWIARLLGYKIFYCPKAICYHKVGTSFRKKPSLTSTYLAYKNNIRLLIKNYSLRNLIFILPPAIFIDAMISFGGMIYKKDSKYFLAFLKAFLWNMINLKDSIKKRKQIQSKRKINDDYLFNFMEKGSFKLFSIIEVFKKINKNR